MLAMAIGAGFVAVLMLSIGALVYFNHAQDSEPTSEEPEKEVLPYSIRLDKLSTEEKIKWIDKAMAIEDKTQVMFIYEWTTYYQNNPSLVLTHQEFYRPYRWVDPASTTWQEKNYFGLYVIQQKDFNNPTLKLYKLDVDKVSVIYFRWNAVA